jgi:intracellular multiplication protein IcmT
MTVADQIQQAQDQLNWHWRNTMRPVRFFNLDARAVLPFCVLIIWARPVTLALCIMITMIFWGVEKTGLTLPASLRKLRALVVGDRRPALRLTRYRRFREFVS